MMIRAMGSVGKIVRELRVGEIRKQAEAPFRLLLLGEATLARRVAELLSASQVVHPWLAVHQTLPAGVEGYDLALLLRDPASPEGHSGEAERMLRAAGVPSVRLVVGPVEGRAGSGASVVQLAQPLDAEKISSHLAPALLAAAPEAMRIALARQLPPLRGSFAQGLIEESSRANALYAATTGLAEVVPLLTIPLNAADIFVLTKNQLLMAFKLALASGKEGSTRHIMGEVLSVLGGGFLFRQIARELVGLIPVIGLLPKIAVAYAGTWVIGRAVYLWASDGEQISGERMRRFYDEAMARGQALAAALLRRASTVDVPFALPTPTGEGPASPGLLARVRQRLPF